MFKRATILLTTLGVLFVGIGGYSKTRNNRWEFFFLHFCCKIIVVPSVRHWYTFIFLAEARRFCTRNNVYFSPQQTVFIEGGRQKLIASVRWQHCRRYIGHVYNGGSDDYCEFDLIIMINVVTQWTLFEIVVDFVCFEKKITSEFLYAFSISL